MSGIPDTQLTNPPVETNASVGGQLSSTVVTYIAISAAGGMLAILLMLFGNFEGKISRVLSTLVLFGLFTCCSSYHLGRSKAAMRSTLLAQAGNIYMLVLGLTLIWGTLAVSNYTDYVLLPMTLCIVGLVQLGLFITDYIARFMDSPHKQLTTSAYLTTAGMVATTFFFTLPIGLNELVTFGESYWRFAIAIILFSGIMISITGFIVWAFRSTHDSSAQDVTMPTRSASNPPAYPGAKPYPAAKPSRHSFDFDDTLVEHSPKIVEPAPRVAETLPQSFEPAPATAPVSGPYVEQGVPSFASPVHAPMSWPVFPNGLPLPARSNGRPDFAALQSVAKIYAESERQFFG